MIYNNVIEMIGKTPILKLNNVVNNNMADIFVKLEKYNPAGSIKDRAALGMIEDAERKGIIKKGDTLVEPTSGNTGIALAMIGKMKGYNVIIVMPETMSVERRKMIKAYGAKLVLTEGSKGMSGAINKAITLVKENGFFMPQQFNNKANPYKHYVTTAKEILEDIKDLDVFVTGVGTGGTISGIGKKLKEFKQNIKVIAVEPENSAVLSKKQPNSHKIQGIGAGFIPEIYDSSVVDEIVTISDDESFKTARLMAMEEGIFVGISSGANVAAALKLAKKLGKGKKIVTMAPDGGEKYLSTGIY